MFSSRLRWDVPPNRLSQLVESKRTAGARILDLTQSNPTHAGLRYPAGILEAFADPRALSYDPHPAGVREARDVVAAHYRERGRHVAPERILLTASTSEAYSYLFKLLANPGDSVLVPRPSYPLFEYLAHIESLNVAQYSLAYHGGWTIDMGSVESALTNRTRALVLVNPNNPTGSYANRGELDRLSQLANARGIPLIADEVFADYRLAPRRDAVTTLVDWDGCRSFSMSGLSKVSGLPQMKLGWIVVNGPEAWRDEAFRKLEWIADTYLSVAAPVQYAASRLLQAGEEVALQIRERTSANLAWAREALAGTAAGILAVEAGWYCIVQVPRVRTEEEWALELLDRHDVLVQPGFFYDFESEAFLVVSLLTEDGIFQKGITRLKEML